MKHILLTAFLFVAAAYVACNKGGDNETTSNIVGNWRLKEIYIDTSSSTTASFIPVTSNKTLTFTNDGVVTCNGDICSSSISVDSTTTGTYSKISATISSNKCLKTTINGR